MSKVENLAKEFEALNKFEKQELIKKLLDKMEENEVRRLIEKMRDENEVKGLLKILEPVFADWDNEEDSVYDNL